MMQHSAMMCPAGHAGQTSHHCGVKRRGIISEQSGETSLNLIQYNDKISVALGGIAMKENKLAGISMNFSVQIISLVKELKSKHEGFLG
jgi:hypothetical protein